jgi:hypothetical protein
MIAPFVLPAFADIASLTSAIAGSPIVVRSRPLEALLADWETTRKSPHVDTVVRAWLRSYARARPRHLSA